MVNISAGETLRMNVAADPTGTVSFRFAGPQRRIVTATHDGCGSFSISEDTAAWQPGYYILEIRETVSGIVSVLSRKRIIVQQSIDQIAAGSDVRSTAQKAVENIEAMLSGSASLEARRYRINNRELERYSVSELLQLLSFWRHRLSLETRKAEGISSLGPRIEVRV